MTTGGQPGGGDNNANGTGGGNAQSAVPWGNVAEGQIWTIGDKPWFETAVPEGPARELIKSKNYANPAVVATSYAELERINASRDDSKMIRIPDANAKPEDWNAVYERLGRPKDISGYKDVKWGEGADPQMVEFGQKLAFKLGLSPKAAESIMASEWNTFVKELNAKGEQTAEADRATALTAIKADWKGDFDANLARGQQVLKALTNAGITDADISSVEQHIGIPALVKMLATIGKLSGEGNLLSTGGQGGGNDVSVMTPEAAKAKITSLTADKDFQKAYMGGQEAGHAEAVKLMESLYKKAGPLMGGAAG